MNVPPTSDEYVSWSWLTVRTSACLVMAQKPGVVGARGCQYTGASRRSRSNWSWGSPLPQVPGQQVDALEAVGHRSCAAPRSSWTVTTPRSAAIAISSVTATGSTRRIISRPSSRPISAGPTRAARVSTVVRVPARHRLVHPGPRGAVAAGEVGSSLVVARRRSSTARARGRSSGRRPWAGSRRCARAMPRRSSSDGGHGQLGADGHGHVVHPALEEGEQQAVLAVEVVVDRAGGALRPAPRWRRPTTPRCRARRTAPRPRRGGAAASRARRSPCVATEET